MIRQHKDEIHTDQGNAARTGGCHAHPDEITFVGPRRDAAGEGSTREPDGRIGGIARGDVHKW